MRLPLLTMRGMARRQRPRTAAKCGRCGSCCVSPQRGARVWVIRLAIRVPAAMLARRPCARVEALHGGRYRRDRLDQRIVSRIAAAFHVLILAAERADEPAALAVAILAAERVPPAAVAAGMALQDAGGAGRNIASTDAGLGIADAVRGGDGEGDVHAAAFRRFQAALAALLRFAWAFMSAVNVATK